VESHVRHWWNNVVYTYDLLIREANMGVDSTEIRSSK
jgi:hypothetical protein